jgi:hypothetical protein
MDRTDPRAFFEFPPKRELKPGTVTCAKCQGHGGWNLTLNCYPMPTGYADTAENRHKYTHFKANCNNCNGWGFVPEAQGDHVHEWKEKATVGNCLTRYKCETCGQEQDVDSSD